ncbi:MAG TPA: ABC transporter permease [Streptosporangiaceae bacterium]|nr:ABC transporter permease [Streptosporangiaceae bacterium]
MTQFILRRLLMVVPVLFGITVLVFSILHLIPGNPAQILLFGSNATPQQVANLDKQLGLTGSIYSQYGNYLVQLLHGNLGYSYSSNQTVVAEISSQLPYTINLALGGLVVALGLGIPLGIVAGVRPGGITDKVATGVAVLGVAIPYFWLAILLVLLFAVKLRVLPALGTGSVKALILPSIALGWGFAAIIARLLRNNLIEVYDRPFMIVARAKGLSEWRLLWQHAMRNAVGSTVTIVGLQFGYLLAGAVAIEVIFGRPGLGAFLVARIQEKDIPSIQGVVLLVAVVYLVVNLLVDVAHGLLDPRIRRSWSR